MPITRNQIATRLAELERTSGQARTGQEEPDLSSRWLMTLTMEELEKLERAMVEGDDQVQRAFSDQLQSWITSQDGPTHEG